MATQQAKRNGSPAALTESAAAYYTVPAGPNWVMVRSIRVVHTGAEGANDVKVTVGIYTSAVDAASRRIIDRVPVAFGAPFTDTDGHALAPGEVMYAFCTPATATITISVTEGTN